MMTKKALKKLRDKLPRGYGKTLSQRTGKTESTVYKALVGKFDSPEIIKSAITLAEETANNNNSLLTQINSL